MTLALAAARESSFRWTNGETGLAIALLLIIVMVILFQRLGNPVLVFVVCGALALLSGIMVAASFPHDTIGQLYHLTGGKMGFRV
jgi:hypothetical protein